MINNHKHPVGDRETFLWPTFYAIFCIVWLVGAGCTISGLAYRRTSTPTNCVSEILVTNISYFTNIVDMKSLLY